MAKSLVERYEQLLAQDPASSVFVELAKALIAKGEHARAIAVCEQGISHHPNSVTGRVLWGKALIHMGRPAEAMAQFDQAVSIDKENPHAYNLISEVLLQRGLFRSALPILRKALALQPNDGRVRAWMEQAQAALAGGPAPAFGDLNALEPQASEESASPPEASGPEASADASAASPGSAPAAAGAVAAPEGAAAASDEAPVLALEASEIEGGTPAQSAPVSPAEAPPAEPPPEETAPLEAAPLEDAGEEPPTDEAPLLLSAEIPITTDVEVAVPVEAIPSGDGGLLSDLPPLEEPAPAPSAAEAPPAAVSEPPTAHAGATGARRGLLEELPEATAEVPVVPPTASTPVSPRPVQDVAALTAAYERELRDKLLPKGSGAILSGLALKVLAAVGLVVVLFGAFLVVRAKQGGQALAAALDRSSRLLEQDTESSRQESLALLSHVLDLEDDNTRAWALSAYAHALRYADSASAEERAQALAALGHPGVRTEHPVSAVLVDALVADAQGRDAANRALLGVKTESPEVQALAGSILLEQGKTKEALERLERALKASPRNVRALLSLGAYYRDAGDPVNALKTYTAAAKLAPEHPVARLGVAESRLELGQELEQALADVQGLDSALPASLRERHRLVRGRLLTALGKAGDARTLLAEGMKGPLAREIFLALGEANRAAGDMAAAQRAFEEALKLEPDSDDAKAGLGRALLDRDREREVLSRVEGESRQVALVRGAAYAKLGDWKRARVELARTRVEDRYPAEAIIYLAQADVAEGERDRAVAALEKTLAAARMAKAEVRTALGLLHWQEKSLDKASSLLEAAAAEDTRGYEAPCALGRLLIARGLPDLAMKPLTQAVERNSSHGESREALGRALLALGRTQEALKQFEAWQLDNPGAAAAHKGFALALYHEGRMKEAEAASARAVKLVTNDPESYRIRSDILFALGDTKGGFSALESANKLDSKSPETFCGIAFAFLRQGLVTNAEAAFAAARREGPEVTCGRAGEHWVEDSGGRAAAKELQAIAEKAATNWDKAFAQAAMARVLLGAGAAKEARTAADEAVKLEPFSGRAHLVLGQVALKQRDEATAMKSLSRAVELEPVDGLAWLALADALVRNPAETERAVTSYQTFLKLAAASPEAGRVKKLLPALLRKVGGK